MSIRPPKNWPRDEIVQACAEDLRQRIRNIDESAIATPEKMNSEEYAPPPRSYWPYIKAAMEKGMMNSKSWLILYLMEVLSSPQKHLRNMKLE